MIQLAELNKILKEISLENKKMPEVFINFFT